MPSRPESDSPYEFAPQEPGGESKPTAAPVTPLPERTCPHCGFRIVGRPAKGRCPECAAPLENIAVDLLQFANGPWLNRMAYGTLLVAAGIMIQAGAILLGWMQTWTLGGVVHAVAGIVLFVGAWMATTREPDAGDNRAPLAPFVRAAAALVGGLWIVYFVALLGGHVAEEGTADGLTITILLASAMLALLLALHLRMFTVRIPNDSLTTHLLNLGFLVPGLCVLLAALQLAGAVKHENLMIFFCAFPLIGGLAVIAAWVVWILIRTGLEFRNCAIAGETIAQRRAMKAQPKPTP